MSYLSGIYVLEDATLLADSLAAGISRIGCRVHDTTPGGEAPPQKNIVEVSITNWCDGWAHIRFLGDVDGTGYVTDHLVVQAPREKVIFCRYEPGLGEFSYSCLYMGQKVERFSCDGPGLESIAFYSELRKTPVTDMVNVRAFMKDSLSAQGLGPRPEGSACTDPLKINFSPPAKFPLIKKLLGTMWPEMS